MSGHSKWSKVKHQKAVTDVVKAAAFTKASRAITMAVKEGGGITDPAGNFRLRLAIEKAKSVNMPSENIKRAIEKGSSLDASSLEQITYEAYGPHKVALIIEATTDNKMRTVSFIKNILNVNGGTLASPGAVGYLFENLGVIVVQKQGKSYDDIFEAAVGAGAVDINEFDSEFEVFTKPTKLSSVKEAVEALSLTVDTVALVYKPLAPVVLGETQKADIAAVVDELEALEDVQKVFTSTHQ